MTKRDKDPQPQPKTAPERWRGDAVEERPGDEAERAAQRAEGNTPIPATVEPDRQPERVQRRAQPTSDPEEEIAEIAEEHKERRDAGERPPRGKL